MAITIKGDTGILGIASSIAIKVYEEKQEKFHIKIQ